MTSLIDQTNSRSLYNFARPVYQTLPVVHMSKRGGVSLRKTKACIAYAPVLELEIQVLDVVKVWVYKNCPAIVYTFMFCMYNEFSTA